jgi:RNA polymerase sigma-70 factor, ECF subfamily
MNSLYVPVETTDQLADAELIQGVLAGKQARAFRILMERYVPLVHGYLYKMTQNHELSEELVQEVFVKVYTHLSSFNCDRPFKPWLMRIAANTAISQLRKNNHSELSLNEMEDNVGFDPASDQSRDNPENLLEEQFASELIMAEVDKLPEKYRIPLLLRYQADYKYEEVAEAMGLPLNTIRTRLKRGLEKLKEGLIALSSSSVSSSELHLELF